MSIDNIKEYLDYNSSTGSFLWKKRYGSSRVKIGSVAGAIVKGYVMITFCGNRYYAHRLAWFLHYGSWPKNDIDHINGIKNDNRIENLRDVSTSDNCINRKCHRDGKLPGCTFDISRGKWYSKIRINGKRIHIGYFSTAEEASSAYLSFKEKMNGA